MARVVVIAIFLSLSLFGEDAFERNCVQCHEALPMTLQKIFMSYLQVYGGENNTKAALKYFLRHPREDTSVMSELFLKNFSLKEPLKINDDELNEAIDIYWERYKVLGKLN